MSRPGCCRYGVLMLLPVSVLVDVFDRVHGKCRAASVVCVVEFSVNTDRWWPLFMFPRSFYESSIYINATHFNLLQTHHKTYTHNFLQLPFPPGSQNRTPIAPSGPTWPD